MSYCSVQAKKKRNKNYSCAAVFLGAFEHHCQVPTTYYHQIFIRVTVGRWQVYMAAIIHQNICNLIKFCQHKHTKKDISADKLCAKKTFQAMQSGLKINCVTLNQEHCL